MSRGAPSAWPLRLAPHALIASLGAGAASALAAPAPAAAAAGLAVALATAAAAILQGRPRAALVALAAGLLMAGWMWGSSRIRDTEAPRIALPASVHGLVEVVTPPRAEAHGSRAEVRAVVLRDGRGTSVPPGARFVADFPEGAPPPLGARLDIRGSAGIAAGPRAPAWWRAHLARRGIAARLRVRSAAPAGRRGGAAGLRDRLRNAAVAAAGRGASGEPAAVVRGLALGGGDGLSQATAQAFRDAGLWHLLAVSGQNIAIVAFAVLAALRGVGVGRRAAVAAAGGVLVAYCLACDGGASVARAGIVGALGLGAELGSRARDRWHLLLAGLVALVLHQPRAIGDPGLQLSFAAVVGILAVAPPVAALLRG